MSGFVEGLKHSFDRHLTYFYRLDEGVAVGKRKSREKATIILSSSLSYATVTLVSTFVLNYFLNTGLIFGALYGVGLGLSAATLVFVQLTKDDGYLFCYQIFEFVRDYTPTVALDFVHVTLFGKSNVLRHRKV